jgi:hypothetical protein
VTYRNSRLMGLLAALGVATMASLAGAVQPEVAPTEVPGHVWLDAEGKPLPFQGDAEISEFLRKAQVVSREEIDVGVTGAEKLLLERDGTRAHAIFRIVDIERARAQVGPRFYRRFRDHYLHECAAHELARWLGLQSVPPAVPRRLSERDGSLQIWVENTRDEESQEFNPPDARAWVEQVWDMELFDNLILNVDRNSGNILVGQQYRLWLIDHTRAFQPFVDLLAPERLLKVNRRVWDRLRDADEEDLRAVVGDYLDRGQLRALAKRRELLLEHIERLVAERGEGAVFY